MNKTLNLSDIELLHQILAGNTKYPIARENWKNFVHNSFSFENTLAFVDFTKYGAVYNQTCIKIGLKSNIKDEMVMSTEQYEENQIDFENEVSNEKELDTWCRSICSQLIEHYVNLGAKNEINLNSDVREKCLKQ